MLRVLTLIALALVGSDGARMLAFLPLGSHSHQNTYRPIFRELAKRGHDVTYVTSLPDKNAPYKQIVVQDPTMQNAALEMDLFALRKNTWFDDLLMMASKIDESSSYILSLPEIQELIHSTELRFDLVFTESTLSQEAYIAFGHKFQAPVVELSGLCPTLWLYHLIGNPYFFSYTTTFSTLSTDRMNFLQRLRNTVMGLVTAYFKRYVFVPTQEAIVEKYFNYSGCETRPPLMDMLGNISLVLQNTHVATHYPHPYNPNVVEIAGVQLQEAQALPKDLQRYLDNAKEGVIYFSFGSVVNCSLIPDTARRAFLSAFQKLPYKVLWKWETGSLPNQPKNVKISKWLPQKDILVHPNVKVFITHGGLASMTEAIFHGVPLLLIPIFMDQWKNSKQVEAAGNGKILDFDNISEESLISSLKEIIEQPSYREAAQVQSRILRDNPLSPVDKAVFWTEYVLRHKGAPHLRPAAASLPWYKYFLVDVVAVLLAVLLLVLITVYLILRTIFRLLFDRSRENGNKILKKKNS